MKKYDIAAYVWPAYTGDEPRTRMFWPEGMGEWQTVKNAVKKFPGHSWPRRPLWGYVNEADPYVMEAQIEAAADHGVNVFIYDWYWYDGRPFLESCLNEGFLKAKNRDKMKFYLMWANHDANNLWDIRLSHEHGNVIWRGAVDRAEFEKAAARLIDKYFKQPNYYKIDGKPVFMFYDMANLIRGLGGLENTRDTLDWFRNKAVEAGLEGLHLQFAFLNEGYEIDGLSLEEIYTLLGFDSATHYQFVHFVYIDQDYVSIAESAREEWERLGGIDGIKYFPHVSVGWDNNPRFKEFCPGVVKNNTPENFEKALRLAKEYIDGRKLHPLITVNSWNEWTETSYLQPDDLYGYGYLQAVKNVFL